MSVSFSSSVPVVGFAGPRQGPAAVASGLVSALVGSVLSSGRAVASGCAVGVDSLAVAAAVAGGAGVGRLAPRLFLFALFGPLGLGAVSSSSVAGVQAALCQGARVAWFAGGRSGPVAGRLAGRSLAFVRFLASSPRRSGLVAVVSGPLPRSFAAAGPGGWPSCGSGSWGSVGAAALLGLPVVVFPVGWAGFAGASSLPLTVNRRLSQPPLQLTKKMTTSRAHPMPQLSLWSLLYQTQQHDAHRQLQQQLPACLTAPRGHPELWRIDYVPQGYRALHRGLQIFTELPPTVTAAIEQAIDMGVLTETLPLPDLELLFDSFAGVLPNRFQHTVRYLECTYPHLFSRGKCLSNGEQRA